MRIIVCGGRDYTDRRTIQTVIGALGKHVTVVHGDARGADRLAANTAWEFLLPTESFAADWASHGPSAGPIRNKQMLAAGADLVIAFPGGRGTAHMVRSAREAGVPVLEVS